RFGKDTEDGCPECGSGIPEDASHVIFECRRFEFQRLRLEEATRWRVTAENLVHIMLSSKRNWEEVSKYIAEVMKALRQAERARR
ncbi:hypothetical protein KR084_001845, partial [Drosophila pseudotakahashii]